MDIKLITPQCGTSGEGISVRLLSNQDIGAVWEYSLRNRLHLAAWEPLRTDDYFEQENFHAMLLGQIEDCKKGIAQRFGIFKDSSVIGLISYTNIIKGPFMACSVGYSIDATFQRQGLMQISLKKTLGYMFEDIGMNRVMANYMPRNVASARVLRKLGFGIEGYARAYLKIAGKWEDHVLTSLLAAEADI